MNPETPPIPSTPADQNPLPPAPQPVDQMQPPIPTVQPTAVPQPNTYPQQMAVPQYQATNNLGTKSHKGLVTGVIAAAVVIILGLLGFVAYGMFFSPAAQAKKASTAFMNAATKNDTTTLFALADVTDAAGKTYLTTAAANVKGSSYHLTDKTMQNDKGYFLYSLPSAKSPNARTIVEKTAGKWRVTSFVYGSSSLKLIPSSSSPTTDSAATAPVAETSTVACLLDSDVAPITQGTALSVDDSTTGIRTYVGDAYFFNPDQTAYTYPDQTATSLNTLASVYKASSNKQFTINLIGQVQDTNPSAANIQLGHARVAKIEADLEALGVPADRFLEAAPTQSSAYNDGSERNVNMKITMKLPCAGASPRQAGE